MNVNRGHGAFRRGDDRELRVRSNIARRVHALDTRLLRLVYPQQAAVIVQTTSERFMKVSADFCAEVEEQRITLERLTLRKDDALQLPLHFVAL